MKRLQGWSRFSSTFFFQCRKRRVFCKKEMKYGKSHCIMPCNERTFITQAISSNSWPTEWPMLCMDNSFCQLEWNLSEYPIKYDTTVCAISNKVAKSVTRDSQMTIIKHRMTTTEWNLSFLSVSKTEKWFLASQSQQRCSLVTVLQPHW